MRCRRLMSLASWRLSIRPCVCVRAANSRTLPASGDRRKCIRQHPCDTPAWGRSTRVCCRYPLPSRLCSHRQVRERDQPFWYGTQGPVIRQGGHLIKPQGPPRDNIGWIGRGRFHPQSRAGWVLNSCTPARVQLLAHIHAQHTAHAEPLPRPSSRAQSRQNTPGRTQRNGCGACARAGTWIPASAPASWSRRINSIIRAAPAMPLQALCALRSV
jgi:hypothetical protein